MPDVGSNVPGARIHHSRDATTRIGLPHLQVCSATTLRTVTARFRLKDLGVLGEDKALERGVDILTHPFLILLVRIYVGFVSPVPTSDSLDALYRLSGFPDVTPQEGHFVGHLLTDDVDNLDHLFEMTPSEVADNPVHEKQVRLSVTI